MRRYWKADIKLFVFSLLLSALSLTGGWLLACSTRECAPWQYFIHDTCAGAFMLGAAGMAVTFLIAMLLIPFQIISNNRENNKRMDNTYD